MAKRRNSRFRKGSGLYMCMACSQLTRETGKGESDLRLCVECYDSKPGDEVALSCGLMTKEEFDAKWTASKPDPFDFRHPVSKEDMEKYKREGQRRAAKRRAGLQQFIQKHAA